MIITRLANGSGGVWEAGDADKPAASRPTEADLQFQDDSTAGLKINKSSGCAVSKAKPAEKCRAIKAEAPSTTHTISVSVDGVPGRIPFIPDR